MHNFLKIHPEFAYNKDISQSSCLCEVCENGVFVEKSIGTFKNDVPNNSHDLVETYSCSSASRECMYGEYKFCSVPVLENEIKSGNITDAMVYQWSKIEKKARKVEISVSLKELVAEFVSQMAELDKHICVKRKQHKYFNSIKDNLKVGKILMSIDYSKNYVNKDQQETQSAYFGHECFSIFTGCCNFRLANGDLVNEKMAVISEPSDHFRIAVYAYVLKIIDHVVSGNIALFG